MLESLDDPYKDRKQAEVKHHLLSKYLERLINIVGRKPDINEFVYVDAFAGPWQESKENYEDTSFGIALSILEQAYARLSNERTYTIRAIFIEKDPIAFRRLEAFTNSRTGNVVATCRNAAFSECVPELAQLRGFSFYLIDPKGFKDCVEADVLRPLLRNQNAELLINFMWSFIKLAVGHIGKNDSHAQNMSRLFGPLEDIAGVKDREGFLIQRYQGMLVSQQASRLGRARIRSTKFRVDNPKLAGTKYYLVFTSHSPYGTIEFAKNSETTEAVQTGIIANEKVRKVAEGAGMFRDLFGATDQQPVAHDTINALKHAWLQLVPKLGDTRAVTVDVFADLIEEFDCVPRDLQAALSRLIVEKVIVNRNAKKLRPTNVVDWSKKEILERVG